MMGEGFEFDNAKEVLDAAYYKEKFQSGSCKNTGQTGNGNRDQGSTGFDSWRYRGFQQPNAHQCPNCGYCPHCGRGGWNWQPIVWC